MTETTIEQGLDIESIELLDFDYEVPCDFDRDLVGAQPCTDPAVWKVITICAHTYLLCQKHLDNVLDALANPAYTYLVCNICGYQTDKHEMLVSVERLDKGR